MRAGIPRRIRYRPRSMCSTAFGTARRCGAPGSSATPHRSRSIRRGSASRSTCCRRISRSSSTIASPTSPARTTRSRKRVRRNSTARCRRVRARRRTSNGSARRPPRTRRRSSTSTREDRVTSSGSCAACASSPRASTPCRTRRSTPRRSRPIHSSCRTSSPTRWRRGQTCRRRRRARPPPTPPSPRLPDSISHR